MSTVEIRSTVWSNATAPINSSAPQNASTAPFHLIGDTESILEVLSVLVSSNCSVVNTTSSLISPYTASNISQPQPEQIAQYYRASTFALSLDGYNNTANLLSRAPASNDSAVQPLSDDMPLPNGTDKVFLSCVNETIGESVPLMNRAVGVAPWTWALIGLFVLVSVAAFVWTFVRIFRS